MIVIQNHSMRNHGIDIKLSAFDSPFTDKEQIQQKIDQFGVNHTVVKVDILGDFPDSNTDSFITLTDVVAAIMRDFEPVGDIEIGLDPARFGDDSTVLIWRQGYKVHPPITRQKIPADEVVSLTINTVKEIRIKTGYQKKIRIKIDVGGLGGPIYDFLKLDRENNIEMIACNFGGAGNERFKNEASIMWGNVKDLIGLISLPDDEILREELSARRMKFTDGRVMIEPKDEFKREFKRSPDRADALVLCFAHKENKHAVIKDFDPLNVNTVKYINGYAGEYKYASVFYSKDLFISIVYGAWDNNRLYIYDEYTTDDSILQVSTNIYAHQPISKIIANERAFSSKGIDIASKYRKYNIIFHENIYYNEIAAIDTLSMMVSQNKLIVNKNCKQTIEQLINWRMDKTNLEREFGLCYAMCNIVSELRKKVDRPQIIIPTSYNSATSSYSPVVQNENSWMVN